MYKISTACLLLISLVLGTYAWNLQPVQDAVAATSTVPGIVFNKATVKSLTENQHFVSYTVTNNTQKTIAFVEIQLNKKRSTQYHVTIAPGETTEIGKHLISEVPAPVLRSVVFTDDSWEGYKVACFDYLQGKAAEKEVREKYRSTISSIQTIEDFQKIKKSVMADISEAAKREQMAVVTEDDGIELMGRIKKRQALTNLLEGLNIIEREHAKGQSVRTVAREFSDKM